jgi:hypothetical protein
MLTQSRGMKGTRCGNPSEGKTVRWEFNGKAGALIICEIRMFRKLISP